jgi:hypothetical protein
MAVSPATNLKVTPPAPIFTIAHSSNHKSAKEASVELISRMFDVMEPNVK